MTPRAEADYLATVANLQASTEALDNLARVMANIRQAARDGAVTKAHAARTRRLRAALAVAANELPTFTIVEADLARRSPTPPDASGTLRDSLTNFARALAELRLALGDGGDPPPGAVPHRASAITTTAKPASFRSCVPWHGHALTLLRWLRSQGAKRSIKVDDPDVLFIVTALTAAGYPVEPGAVSRLLSR